MQVSDRKRRGPRGDRGHTLLALHGPIDGNAMLGALLALRCKSRLPDWTAIPVVAVDRGGLPTPAVNRVFGMNNVLGAAIGLHSSSPAGK